MVIGYPLVAFFRRRGLHFVLVLFLVLFAGLALGLVPLVVAPFIPAIAGYGIFIAMYTAAIGAWCAVGGQPFYPVFRRHPPVGLGVGAVVIALAIVGWALGL